ncbi:MAG: SagB/ThcOx family dehydrogenase [Candidatus Sumerlaeota bacterium]|nr:SagB/ThcOx family dehydrogenase [Candidatus Sumerlaeota bacterium]
MPKINQELGRYFLKDSIRLETDFSQTGQQLGAPPPPLEKPAPRNSRRVKLPKPAEWKGIQPLDLTEAMAHRQSRRDFSPDSLTLDELAFLLWATQGVRSRLNARAALRVVPSAGARHAFETYLCLMRVEGIEPGFYRYLPLEHELVFEFVEENAAHKIAVAALGQEFVGQAAAVFIWTAIPARMEWRYGTASYKVIAVDAGHVCQNLYLACEAIDAGTCAVAAYDQEAMDRLLRVDGKDEFVIYLAPVGKRV